MRIVFAGTPEFARAALDALLAAGHEVPLVLTQPDRPSGRGMKLRPSPVKEAALAQGIPVSQPRSLRLDGRHPEDALLAQQALREAAPELMVVAAYGLILPRWVLELPRHGCFNIHASLLPRWRGAAPIQRAIQAGDAQTGVCLMQMEKGLDTGPVLRRTATPILPDDTAGSLHDRLAELGAALLHQGLEQLRATQTALPTEPQDPAHATYAHKLDKAEAHLDWHQPAAQLARKVRAFSPWPVAEAVLEGERLRLHEAVAIEGDGAPGTILAAGREGIDVATGAGALRLLRVQRDGGKVLAAADYLNARPALRR